MGEIGDVLTACDATSDLADWWVGPLSADEWDDTSVGGGFVGRRDGMLRGRGVSNVLALEIPLAPPA